MATPFQTVAKSVGVLDDTATLKKENEQLRLRIAQLEQESANKDRALEQYRNMHCYQIADMLVIRSNAITSVNGKNVVERTNASRETEKLITDYVNNYGVEEYADVYYGKINNDDIHRHPFKHSKLDVVSGCFKEKGHYRCASEAFGQWVVDRPWT